MIANVFIDIWKAFLRFLNYLFHEVSPLDLIADVVGATSDKLKEPETQQVVGLLVAVLVVWWIVQRRLSKPAEAERAQQPATGIAEKDPDVPPAEGFESLEENRQWCASRIFERLKAPMTPEIRAELFWVINAGCNSLESYLKIERMTVPPVFDVVTVAAARLHLTDTFSAHIAARCNISKRRAEELLQELHKAAREVAVKCQMAEAIDWIDQARPTTTAGAQGVSLS